MSDYVTERAERVLKLLDEEDGKVVEEHIRNREAAACAAQKYRYEGPWWGMWVAGALVVGGILAGGSYGFVGCVENDRVNVAARCEPDLQECRQEVARKQEAIVSLGKECGEKQP